MHQSVLQCHGTLGRRILSPAVPAPSPRGTALQLAIRPVGNARYRMVKSLRHARCFLV